MNIVTDGDVKMVASNGSGDRLDAIVHSSAWNMIWLSLAGFATAFVSILQLCVLVMVFRQLGRTPYVYVANLLMSGSIRSITALFCLVLMIIEYGSTSKLDIDLFYRWTIQNPSQQPLVAHDRKSFLFLAILTTFTCSFLQFAAALDRYCRVCHCRLGIRKCSGFIYVPIVLCVWALSFVVALIETYQTRSDIVWMKIQNAAILNSDFTCRRLTTALTSYSVLGQLSGLVLCLFGLTLLLTNLMYLRMYFFMRNLRRMRPVYNYSPRVNSGWIQSSSPRANALFGTNFVGSDALATPCQQPPPGAAKCPQQKSVLFCFRLNLVCQMSWLPGLVLALSRLVACFCQRTSFTSGFNVCPNRPLPVGNHTSGYYSSSVVLVDVGDLWWTQSVSVIENAYIVLIPFICIRQLLGEKPRTPSSNATE